MNKKPKKIKKSMPKVVAPKVVWKTVARRDIKYDTISLPKLLEWIKDSVPAGTKDEDIELEIEVDESHGYYDDIIVEVDMVLKVLQEVK